MLLSIENILTSEELTFLRNELATAQFVDGKATAGSSIRHLKNNLQLQRQGNQPMRLDQIVAGCLTRHPTVALFTLPTRVVLPLYSKYEPGMDYSWHVDGAIMGSGSEVPVHTHISCTLFLNDPADYDGGELEIQTGSGTVTVKLPAGHAVLYEATTLHRVRPVTRGARLVAVTWIQSQVPDEGLRQILYDIAVVRNSIAAQAPDSGEVMLLSKSYANLLRKAVAM